MIVSALFVLFAISLGLALLVVRGQQVEIERIEDTAKFTRPVDLPAFQNLTDPAEERFLREHLPAKEFQAIRRERYLVALEYVKRMSRNAVVLLRIGESAQKSSDPVVARAAHELVNNAIRFRIHALLLMVKMYPTILIPGMALSTGSIRRQYESLACHIQSLCDLEAPMQSSTILSAL